MTTENIILLTAGIVAITAFIIATITLIVKIINGVGKIWAEFRNLHAIISKEKVRNTRIETRAKVSYRVARTAKSEITTAKMLAKKTAAVAAKNSEKIKMLEVMFEERDEDKKIISEQSIIIAELKRRLNP